MSALFESTHLYESIGWLVLLLLGTAVAYYRTSAKLQSIIGNLIAQAEATYRDSKTGNLKFEWVCDKIYYRVPKPLRAFITDKMIETLVQSTFNAMAAYAKMQLDKLLDSTMPDIERTGDSPCLK